MGVPRRGDDRTVTRQLTVHNAEVRTATVEVRTLTISGKQVTLAVFRQLIEDDLVDGDGNFRGLPWGTVNYHPDKCGDKEVGHLHVVWQQGSELRRTRCSPPFVLSDDDPVYLDGRVTGPWLDAAIADGWRLNKPCPSDTYSIVVAFGESAGLVRMALDSDHRWVLQERSRWDTDREEKLRAEALDAISARVSLERSEATRQVVDSSARVRARHKRLNERWVEIEALPQLFIAV